MVVGNTKLLIVKSYFWHFVHNLVAHPLLVLPSTWNWTDTFHDWSADKAYLSVEEPPDVLGPSYYIDETKIKTTISC